MNDKIDSLGLSLEVKIAECDKSINHYESANRGQVRRRELRVWRARKKAFEEVKDFILDLEEDEG